MVVVVLGVVLALVVAGCVAVVWASRGGPRWVRGVATVTLATGDLVKRAGKNNAGNRNSGSTGGGD
ncbi:hypothetical protein [Streptomyces niveus]